MKTLFECKGNECYEKAIVEMGCIPNGWFVIGIAQNLTDDGEQLGACEFQIEFCSIQHMVEKLSDEIYIKMTIQEESEENA